MQRGGECTGGSRKRRWEGESKFERIELRVALITDGGTGDRLGLGSKAVTTATGIEKERAEAKSLLEQWLREVPGAYRLRIVSSLSDLKRSQTLSSL